MTLRFALIGAGYIANYHAKALLAHPDAEIKAVCALEEEQARLFAHQYAIPDFTTDYTKLCDRTDIDAVILGTPNKFHAPHAIQFLTQGKDVFIEKPLAMNSEEGQHIASVAGKENRLVMVGHMWRFDTEVNYIKEAIQAGKIGWIVKTKGYGIHVNWGPEGWFVKKELAGGGALADMGVHAIDTVRYLLNDPKPVQVFAKIGTYYGEYDVDDTGILMITWDNGTTSLIESGWWHPHADGEEASTQLFGTKGYAHLFPTSLKFKIGGVAGEFIAPMPDREEHCAQIIYTRQMAHFIDCLQSRKNPVPGIKEGLQVLAIVDAAYESAKTNQPINL
jgi:predicted dehydrogenase